MEKIILLYVIIVILNIFWVFSYFTKLIGVETKRWSTSISIFQIINLLPRTIGVLQIPIITLYTENAINNKGDISILFFQGIIFFNFVGLVIGTILLPYFSKTIKNIIGIISEKETFKIFTKKEVWQILFNFFKNADFRHYFNFGISNKVKYYSLFFYNSTNALLLCIALPACVLAGYKIPEYRATIISLVSIIYGFATLINIILVETKLSILTDKTFHGNLEIDEYKLVLFDCLKGRLLGTFVGIFLLSVLTKVITLVTYSFLI